MFEITFIFSVLLIITAFLYASVGHGGASGYLALMMLFEFQPEYMRTTALILNIFISQIAFIQYYSVTTFDKKLVAALLSLSIPAAFIGGQTHIDSLVYKKILGVILLIAIIRILFIYRNEDKQLKPVNYTLALLLGGTTGFLSGLIGIGGGIILSPVLLLLKWTTIKQTAAISALFIAVNSIAGLAGNLSNSKSFLDGQLLILITIALAGGALGSYYGARHFNSSVLRIFLALVLLLASLKLYFS